MCLDRVAGLKWDDIQVLTAVDEKDVWQMDRWYDLLGRLLLDRKSNDDVRSAFERCSGHMPTRLAPACDSLDCARSLIV